MSADAYLSARAEFARVQAEVEKTAKILAHTATALQRQPDRMIFSNVPGGLPMEAGMSRDSISINGDDFPAPAQMQALLIRFHEARDKLRGAWFAIPQEMQSGLQPPPPGVLPTKRPGGDW